MAPPRIGLTVSWENPSLETMLRAVRLADECGFEAFFVPEAWGREAWVLLGYLAAQTQRIHLGTGIVNVYSRSAAVLAMAAATLDDLSGGRALLGLGSSGKGVIEGWHGVPMEKPMERLRDYVAIVRKILRHDHSRYEGETVSLAPGFALRFRPPRPAIPIYLANLTPGGIRLAGEMADGWMPFLTSPESLASDVAALQQGLDRAGRARSDVTVAPYILCSLHDDLETARRPARELIAFYIGGMGRYYYETISRHGFASAADHIRELWAARRRTEAEAAVPDELVDAVCICGPTERCRTRMEAYRQAGADMPIVSLPQGATLEQAEAVVRALAPG